MFIQSDQIDAKKRIDEIVFNVFVSAHFNRVSVLLIIR